MNIIETNLSFNNLSYGNIPNKIILHHAEASCCTVYDIHEWHKDNGWAGIGYHFFVDKQGNIYKGRPIEAIGSHCKGKNTGSIGICAEGAYMEETMPEAQRQVIIQLCIYLCEQYGIDKTEIYGHRELGESNCPGDNYPLQNIKDSIINGNNEESVDMNKIVVYTGDIEAFSAVIVSQRHNCPMMKLKDFNSSGIKASEVIQIGGKEGSNRYTTFQDAGSLI